MLTDRNPSVYDTDDYIKEWVRQRGQDRLPKVYVPLGEAMHEDVPDMALIHYDQPGEPVERILVHAKAL